MRLLLIVSDAWLLGLGITIALVVYPSFPLVDDHAWEPFHKAHERRMAWAVAPAWVAQGIGTAWSILSARSPASLLAGTFATCAVLLTALVIVPIHHRIQTDRAPRLLSQLRLWHWCRVLLWAGCLALAVTVR